MNLTRPPMPTPWDDERAIAQASVLSMVQGRWEALLQDWVYEHVDKEIAVAAWGQVDTSVNPLADINRQLSTPGLYGRRPQVRHAQNTDALTGPNGLLERAGWFTRGQRLEFLARCLGDMLVRFSTHDDQLLYRFAWPHDVYMRGAPHDPATPVEVRELRVREVRNELVYVWECWDVESGTYRIILPRPGSRDLNEGEDVTNLLLGGEPGPMPYPLYDPVTNRPLLPYVHYQAADTGQLWNHELQKGLVRGTLNAAMYATYAGNCARHATGSHVIIYGLQPSGVVARKGGAENGAPYSVRPLTPGAVVYHQHEPGQDVGVHEVGPGVNLESVSGFARYYEGAQGPRYGLPFADATEKAANPTSGSALAITNEGRRDQAQQLEPLFRRKDLEAIHLAAALCEADGLGSFPLDGYAILYHQIPRSPGEQAERRDDLAWKLERGMISRIDVYMELNPGSTREAAAAALRQVDEDNAALAAATATAIAEPPADPEPDVDDEES